MIARCEIVMVVVVVAKARLGSSCLECFFWMVWLEWLRAMIGACGWTRGLKGCGMEGVGCVLHSTRG